MNNEKKYNELVGKIKRAYLYAQTNSTKAVLEDILPELKESKDERIRKVIYDWIYLRPSQFFDDGFSKEEMLAWLEKQGKRDERYKDVEELLEADAIYQMAMNDAMVEEAKNKAIRALSNLEISKLLRLEKQVEQKPTNKVEPKFHEGNWVISNDKKSTYQVIEVKRGIYVVRDNVDNHEYHIGIEEGEKSGRLWSIYDAKPGDVLVASDGSIFLFGGVDDSACKYYAALTADNYIKINKEAKGGYWETSRAVYPATKEQRDLLFQKMEEAGYMWDDNKKELKKIEQKSTEWYEKTKGLDELETYILSIVPNRPLDAVKVDSKNIRFLINKEQRLWSEEDKDFMYDTLSNLTELKDRYGDGYGNVGKCIGWLKSLKDRYAWKPSEEQLDALQYVYRNSNPLPSDKLGWNSLKTLELMYHDLKKLKVKDKNSGEVRVYNSNQYGGFDEYTENDV